jgi:drug/metabolite transporter (DMT)-like permease
LAATAAMWGMVFVAIAKVRPYLDSFQVVTIRFGLIGLIFAALMAARPETRPKLHRSDLPRLFAVGVVLVPVTQIPIVYGQKFLSPPLVSVIVSTAPAWTAIFAVMLLSERFRLRQIAGFLIARSGACAVILAGSGDAAITVDDPLSATLTLATPIGWALYTVMSKPMSAKYPPITGVGIVLVAGAITMIPLMPHAISGLDQLPASAWGWMVYLVIGGTVVPYLLWFKALTKLTASQVSAYMFAVPFATLGASWLILDIVPEVIALLGGGLIIAGVVMTQLAAGTNPRPPNADLASGAPAASKESGAPV